ncbi:class E sortase [Actinomadura viridis]|uniref:class E sortase n=1 Tax=Actinomadura viridis TaxID=58110 RepID=UPI0036828C0F
MRSPVVIVTLLATAAAPFQAPAGAAPAAAPSRAPAQAAAPLAAAHLPAAPPATAALPVSVRAASPTTALAPAGAARPRKGERIARISIPRLNLHRPVHEGVSQRVLARGLGHYPRTAAPGRVGNSVILGHRTTHLAPFHDLGLMRRGDRIALRSGGRTYVYRVYAKRIIAGTNTRVLAPVPFHWSRTPRRSVLTLITCHPKGSDRQRLVVLARKVAGKAGKPGKAARPSASPR